MEIKYLIMHKCPKFKELLKLSKKDKQLNLNMDQRGELDFSKNIKMTNEHMSKH